jgi:flagellar protein FlgJ
MMLKSMREASSGDPLFDSEEGSFYRDMFDDQLAVDMSSKGSLGLADVLVRQLSRTTAPEQAVAADGEKPSAPQREFVQRLWPLAVDAGRALGVDPRHIVAQAALETGWGQHQPGNNLFGIKSTGAWSGARVSAMTTEYVQGEAQSLREGFRSYASDADSVRDYVKLLGASPRYSSVRGTGGDIDAFGQALQSAGYATDPAYASKLRAVNGTVAQIMPPLKNPDFASITASQSLL